MRSPYETPEPDPTGPYAWMDRAACAGYPLNIWFPERSGDASGEARFAKRICANCEVRDICGQYGQDEQYGIYGGLTTADRRAITADKKETAHQAHLARRA